MSGLVAHGDACLSGVEHLGDAGVFEGVEFPFGAQAERLAEFLPVAAEYACGGGFGAWTEAVGGEDEM